MRLQITRRAIMLAAACAGLLAALLVLQFLRTERARAAARIVQAQPGMAVVVPVADVPARTILDAGSLRVETRPSLSLPGNCCTEVGEVVDKVSLVALPKEQPIQREQIAVKSAALGLSYVVPTGMRAVTVALDPIIGVAGFLKPGDRVDVLATFTLSGTPGGAGDRSVTQTVLQDVELLALGAQVRATEVSRREKDAVTSEKETARPAEPPREQPNATLAVTPQDAQKLILAENKGKLRLTLRGVDDRAKEALHYISTPMLIVGASGSDGGPRPRVRIREVGRAPITSLGYHSPAFTPGFRARSSSGMGIQPFLWPVAGQGAGGPAAGGAQSGKVVEVVRGLERTATVVPRRRGEAAVAGSGRVSP